VEAFQPYISVLTHADLPPGFQTAEFMMQHGLVDMIVDRKDMRPTLAKVLRYMVVAKKA
jgi:acetyl-CoA carboxylase carboxyl transferase subunit beta